MNKEELLHVLDYQFDVYKRTQNDWQYILLLKNNHRVCIELDIIDDDRQRIVLTYQSIDGDYSQIVERMYILTKESIRSMIITILCYIDFVGRETDIENGWWSFIPNDEE